MKHRSLLKKRTAIMLTDAKLRGEYTGILQTTRPECVLLSAVVPQSAIISSARLLNTVHE